MLWGLAQRWGLPECVTFASAVGCLNGRVLGANEGLPSLDEVEALIQEQGTLADYVFRKS